MFRNKKKPITNRQLNNAIKKHKEKKEIDRKIQNRKSMLKNKYGITLDQYEAMYNQQHGLCAICFRISDRLLVVDHDHTTGHIRGLLCHNCNIALGLLQDSTDVLLSAIAYLKSHNKDTC